MTDGKMLRQFLALAGLTFVAGCSFISAYQRPEMDVPASYVEASSSAVNVAKDWWKNFGSEELNRLMDEALIRNNDLRASIERINQAQAALRVTQASLFPSVDLAAGAARERTTRPDSTETTISAGPAIAYELDLFGRNSARIARERATARAQVFDHAALRLVVMAEVARVYFNVLNNRERLRVADDNLKNNREVLRIVQARFDAGAADALDVARQKTELASAEAARASVELLKKNAEHALAVLLGRAPETLNVEAQSLAALQAPDIAPGQPSNLITRRPDISAAEADLVSAEANIAVARAAFLPSITLGLDWTLASSGFGDPSSSALLASASLLGPLFRGGQIKAQLDSATARQRELVELYRKSVLVAFQDVEDSLAAVKAAQQRETSLRTAMQEARKSYELSRSRYDSGAIDFQTLLDAQRTLLQAEDAFAQSKNERLSAATGLFKALGGGWEESADDR